MTFPLAGKSVDWKRRFRRSSIHCPCLPTRWEISGLETRLKCPLGVEKTLPTRWEISGLETPQRGDDKKATTITSHSLGNQWIGNPTRLTPRRCGSDLPTRWEISGLETVRGEITSYFKRLPTRWEISGLETLFSRLVFLNTTASHSLGNQWIGNTSPRGVG